MSILSFRGWPLALSGFVIFFVTNGMTRTNGVIFPALMAYESLDRETASWPLNLPGASIVFMSPVTGYLNGRFSPASLMFVGMIIYCLGILPGFFSTNIYVLSVFYGIVKGCGLAMVITTASSSIATAFHRNRTTAMGIATAGTSSAGLILPLLTEFFLNNYGLKGTFLMLTGVSMHALIGAVGFMAYKRVQNLEFNEKVPEKHSKPSSGHPVKTAFKTEKTYGSIVTPVAVPSSSALENNGAVPSVTEADPASGNLSDDSRLELNEEPSKTHKGNITPATESNTVVTREEEHRDSNINIKPASTGNKPLATQVQQKKPSVLNSQTLKKIFTSKGFYLISLTQLFTVYLGTTFTQVIVDYLADKGIDSSSAVLMITVTACGEIAGRLCFGWITDGNYFSHSTQIAVSLTMSTVMTIVCTFTNLYWLLMTSAFILGLFQGSALSVNLVQVADYFTRAEVPLAMSFTRAINGLAFVTRAPIIGVFRDKLGSYDNLFRILGGLTLVLAMAWAAEGIYDRRKKSNYQRIKESA